MEDIAKVPICVAGGITPTFPSFCMDEATHLVHTAIVGPIRVRPINKEAKEALEKFENAKVIVTVCGYQRSTANCHHLDAYYVDLASEFAAKLAGG